MRTEEMLFILLGFLLRLAIPISATALVAYVLKKLDDQWRAESMLETMQTAGFSGPIDRLKCWEVFNCDPDRRENCKSYKNADKPCWESMQNAGQLQESCRRCPYRLQLLTVQTV